MEGRTTGRSQRRWQQPLRGIDILSLKGSRDQNDRGASLVCEIHRESPNHRPAAPLQEGQGAPARFISAMQLILSHGQAGIFT